MIMRLVVLLLAITVATISSFGKSVTLTNGNLCCIVDVTTNGNVIHLTSRFTDARASAAAQLVVPSDAFCCEIRVQDRNGKAFQRSPSGQHLGRYFHDLDAPPHEKNGFIVANGILVVTEKGREMSCLPESTPFELGFNLNELFDLPSSGLLIIKIRLQLYTTSSLRSPVANWRLNRFEGELAIELPNKRTGE